jgi:hypothetical protein
MDTNRTAPIALTIASPVTAGSFLQHPRLSQALAINYYGAGNPEAAACARDILAALAESTDFALDCVCSALDFAQMGSAMEWQIAAHLVLASRRAA